MMARIEVPAPLMVNKLNKLNNWHNIGLKEWRNQFGLIQKFNELGGEGSGEYYSQEKGHYPLWEFILYADHYGKEAIIQYYGFPNDIVEFIKVIFNDCSAMPEWKNKKSNANKEQMNYFPYEKLYEDIWRPMVEKQQNDLKH